jgi:hypothetical protein
MSDFWEFCLPYFEMLLSSFWPITKNQIFFEMSTKIQEKMSYLYIKGLRCYVARLASKQIGQNKPSQIFWLDV